MLIREVNRGGWWMGGGAGTGPGGSMARTGVTRTAEAKWQPVKCFQTVAANQSIKVLLLIRAAMCSCHVFFWCKDAFNAHGRAEKKLSTVGLVQLTLLTRSDQS